MSVLSNGRSALEAGRHDPAVWKPSIRGEEAAPLERLVQTLTVYGRSLTLDEMTGAMRQTPLMLSDVQTFVEFQPREYSRKPVYRCDHFEVLCLSWLSGQCSPIHDHGHSRCCVRVIHGTLTNTDLERGSDGRFSVLRKLDRGPGELVATPPKAVHQAGNEQDAQHLVTLHVYSPRVDETQTVRIGDE